MSRINIALHDTAISGCLNANGGYSYKMAAPHLVFQGIYQGSSTTGEPTTNLSQERITTACIDSWGITSASSMTASREYGYSDLYLNEKNVDASDGVGLSAKTVGGNFILSDYYLQVSGVVNNAYDAAKPVSTTAGAQESHPYAVVAGSSDGVTALQIGVRQVPSALWYSQTGGDIMDPWLTVGDESFPGIIVRDEDIAQAVARSAAKANGLYNVGQPYQIYQAPSGIAGNWLDGTVESFLLAPWAYGIFQEHGYDTARDWVNRFCHDFYRVENGASSCLTGFGAEMTAQCPVDPSLADDEN